MDMTEVHYLVVEVEHIRRKALGVTVVPKQELCSAEGGTASPTVAQIHMYVQVEENGGNEGDSGKNGKNREDTLVARLQEERREKSGLS